MRDGWPYVLASYAIVAATLGAWFAMIGVKLRRLRRERTERGDG